jgi:hypothetical protein
VINKGFPYTTTLTEVEDFLANLNARSVVGIAIEKRIVDDLAEVSIEVSGISKNAEVARLTIRDFAENPRAQAYDEGDIEIVLSRARNYARELAKVLEAEPKEGSKFEAKTVYANCWGPNNGDFKATERVEVPPPDKGEKNLPRVKEGEKPGFLFGFKVPTDAKPIPFFRTSFEDDKTIRWELADVTPCCGTCPTVEQVRDALGRRVNFCPVQNRGVPLSGVCSVWGYFKFDPCGLI